MAAICGWGEASPARPPPGRAGASPSLDAMLAALADFGSQTAHCATAAGGLGCRWHEGGSLLHRPGEGPLLPPGLAIVADVRLDDRAALGDALGLPRGQAASLADAALVLHAYARWGEDCATHLFGDFAFAIWDERARSFFCARDHIGVRPFYYSAGGGTFTFASAVEGVLAGPGAAAELDEAAVAAWLSTQLPHSAEGTFFAKVVKLPPGHSLTVRLDAGPSPAPLRATRYWRPERLAAAEPASDGEYAEEFLHLYGKSVKARLGDGRVGVHVSGGLDSSSVAVLAARELRRQGQAPPIAFNWLQPPTPVHTAKVAYASEHATLDAALRWAAAGRSGSLPRCYCPLRAVDMVAALSRDGTLRPGTPDPSVRRAALFGVRTMLSGFGGDQGVSYSGPGYFEWLLLRGRWVRLLSELRHFGGGWPRTLLAIALRLAGPNVPFRRPKQLVLGSWRLIAGAGFPRTARPHSRWLIDPGFARRTAVRPLRLARFTSVRRAQLQALQWPVLAAVLESNALDGAVNGMAFRFPLLDRRLLEFVLGLPPEQFRRGPWNRYLMRAALAGEHGPEGPVLPPEIAWRKSKVTPIASDLLDTALDGAVPLIRRRLQASKQPSRAGYVDMARLNACLAPGAMHRSQRVPCIRALSFLDFE